MSAFEVKLLHLPDLLQLLVCSAGDVDVFGNKTVFRIIFYNGTILIIKILIVLNT
jgi:hypothetical protein